MLVKASLHMIIGDSKNIYIFTEHFVERIQAISDPLKKIFYTFSCCGSTEC